MTRRRKLLLGLGLCFIAVLGVGIAVFGGSHEGPGVVHPAPVPGEIVRARSEAQQASAELLHAAGAKQILFGDLHVHTTYSPDAFMRSLPLVAGEGAHPPADACDYARFCSGLDFYALADHAEAMTVEHWRESIESVRACNAVASDPEDPDLAAFIGFEWTQVGASADTHYGHKNVIFRDSDPAALPTRPIGADGPLATLLRDTQINAHTIWLPFVDGRTPSRYGDYRRYRWEIAAMPDCPPGVDVRALPPECRELAATPAELFDKLDEWGFEALVIPHGSTWGFYTPSGYSWDKQIDPAQDDPRQRLVEVYSGHGNSEQYRSWRASEWGDEGEAICPAPRPGFEPCCWRAGELIRARCGDISETACEARVSQTRALYLEAGVAGHRVVPGASVEDWGACDQCTDCFNPSYSYRPGGSAQYMLAKAHFEEGQPPRHARYGFIASSDNHLARPGTGYKEFARHGNTEAVGPRAPRFDRFVYGAPVEATPEPVAVDPADPAVPPFARTYLERQASFFMTGGLVAVHAERRGHTAIWDALARREVYGTSGPRMLLWFDLLRGEEAVPMGSEVELRPGEIPRFRVRAAGAFEQLPGCPGWVSAQLTPERIHGLCLDECDNPGARRHAITRIELVRVRLQQRPDQSLDSLIEDPWMVTQCDASESGTCTASFEDPEAAMGTDSFAYYARAVQAPTPAVNAGGLRCTDASCETLDPCYGDYRVERSDDCLSDNEERAWSSPIWLSPASTGAP